MLFKKGVNSFFILLLFLSVNYSVKAQVKDWKDVSKEELEMEVYPQDSSASAVVLFDRGNLRVEDDIEYFLDRHVRIKLLRPEGYKWGTVELDYNEAYDQEIEDLEAATYVLNDKGIDKFEVKKNAIFEETIINDWKSLKFTFPSLQPGCIIEFKYTLKVGEPKHIPVWYFNKRIPVLWSELTAEFPNFLKVSGVMKKSKELHIEDVEPFRKSIGYSYEDELNPYGATVNKRGSINFNAQRYRWVMKDSEGIPDLPFITTPDDYKSRIQFQLKGYKFSEDTEEDFIKNWQSVTNYLLNNTFVEYLQSQQVYDDIVSSLSLEGKSSIEKVRLIFDYVTESYIWNDRYNLYGELSLKDFLSSKTGSGAELNLLLTGLLREAKINAYPVLISTRRNGSVIKDFVLPNQFNHAITLVKIGNIELLLDASQGNRSLYILPENDLNGHGLVLKKNNSEQEEWVLLSPLQNTVQGASLKAKVNTDGSLNGKLSGVSSGYFAQKDRNLIKEGGEENFIEQKFMNEFSEYNISQNSVTNAAAFDSTLSFDVMLDSARPAETQVIDSTIYLDAIPIMKWSENPLKQDQRSYPVDFTYPYSELVIITYQVPDGYVVEEHPERLVSRIANGGGSFLRMVNLDGNKIIVRSVLKIGRSTYETSEYARLKLFFDQILEAHSEKIVLKKETES